MNTEIIIIMDRSGSMQVVASDVVGGFNGFIAGQKAIEGAARVTLVQFNDRVDTIYEARPLSEVQGLTFNPGGGTALLDAIGQTLNRQDGRIKREGWAQKTVCVIMTDGEENSSREYRADRIKLLTSALSESGWTFVYIGANQDAFKVAQTYGVSNQFTQQYKGDSIGTQAAYNLMNASVGAIRSASIDGYDLNSPKLPEKAK